MGALNKLLINIPDGTGKYFHHRGSRADLGVLEQIFKNKNYSLGRLRRANDLISIYQDIVKSGKAPLIIDAGANIGASAFWFSLTYPNSHTVCFEPDAGNFELLKLNTSGLNVELHQAAIGSVDGSVDLADPGEGEWSYQTIPNPNGIIKMISLNNVVRDKKMLGYQPFIVKIDIEGGEGELFSTNTDWIDAFPLLIIELHDWLLPSKKTSANFLRAISHLDRDFVYKGENIFSIKNGPK
jgi:FkbM family methyltransferase